VNTKKLHLLFAIKILYNLHKIELLDSKRKHEKHTNKMLNNYMLYSSRQGVKKTQKVVIKMINFV